MKIDKNSYGTLAIVYLCSAAVLVPVLISGCPTALKLFIVLFLVAFCVWQTLFFRVPERKKIGDERTVTAVADGRVVILEKVFEPEYLRKECIQVSIYMNFWDVHANFWPVDGVVTYSKYHPGKHVLAFKPKASDANEHHCTAIRTPGGQEVFFKQISGTFARRIVCYAKPGLEVKAGDQCGIIKFGSRIDMFLPIDAIIDTRIGEEPVACESIIARLR